MTMLRTIIKKFRDEGEDIVQLHAAMRDRVRDLHKDWEGEGSKKFFGEMENELLPALSRLPKPCSSRRIPCRISPRSSRILMKTPRDFSRAISLI